jgi:SAM-dependent methyltransferase
VDEDEHYWSQVYSAFCTYPGRALWRECSDQLYTNLIESWLGHGREWDKVLKTDLFDEAVHDGLVSRLTGISREVHGVDLSPEVVDAACKRCPHLVARCADTRALPYPDDTFDLILSNSTLDHFREPGDIEVSLGEFHRVLKPGGSCLVTLDNLDNPVIALRRKLPHSWMKRLNLVPFFPGETLTREGLRDSLQSVGFRVKDERTVLHAPRVLVVWLASLFEKGPSWLGELLIKAVAGAEVLEKWPFSRYTGYYVAALVTKRS